MLAGCQFFARAEHQPWPLHRGEALTADDSLMTAAGLGAPRPTPGALLTPGVNVLIGRPERSSRQAGTGPARTEPAPTGPAGI